MNKELLRTRLSARRAELGMSYEALRNETGVTINDLMRIECPEHDDDGDIIDDPAGDLTFDEVATLAKSLGVRAEWLLGSDDEMTPGVISKRALTLVFDGYDAEKVESRVISQASAHVQAKALAQVQKALDETIAQRLGPAVDKAIEEQIQPLVAKALADGWKEYSKYGDKTETITVVGQLRKLFERKVTLGDYSSRREELWVENLARGLLQAWVDKELAADLAEARKKFKATVDETMTRSLAETVRKVMAGG